MIWLTLVVIIFVYAVHWHFKTKEYRRKLSKIKCEPSLPLLGHALELKNNSTNLLEVVERMWNKLGRDKFLLKLGPFEQVAITHPDDFEVILSSNVILKKNSLYDGFRAWIGNGLLISNGAQWRMHRKILTPAFHFKVIESFLDIYENSSKYFIKKVLENQRKDVDIKDLVSFGVVNSLTQGALGIIFSSEEDMSTFTRDALRMEFLLHGKLFTFWKRIDALYNLTDEHKEYYQTLNNIRSILLKICNDKREELKELIDAISSGKTSIEELTTGNSEFTKKKFNFIEILLLSRKPNGEPLTVEEINDEINTSMLAGFETVSSAIGFTLYALAQHPEIQENVYQEQLDITNGDLSKPLTYTDLQNMKYLDRVIKESMRIYPPATVLGREITEDITLKDGTVLPDGCSILMFPFLTYRNPDIFKDPLKFDPDRFLHPIPLYSYIPFSAGPRNCIGQKLAITLMKSWLATILRFCIVRPSKLIDIDLVIEIALSSKTGIHLQFEKR